MLWPQEGGKIGQVSLAFPRRSHGLLWLGPQGHSGREEGQEGPHSFLGRVVPKSGSRFSDPAVPTLLLSS